MFTTSTRLKLQSILRRMAECSIVSLSDPVDLPQCAECDRTVKSWLHRARRRQLSGRRLEGLESFLDELDLGRSDPHQHYSPEADDLCDWFVGAGPWLRRD